MCTIHAVGSHTLHVYAIVLRFYALCGLSDVYSDDMYNWMHLHHTYKSLEMDGACDRYYVYGPLALQVPRFVVFHCLL